MYLLQEISGSSQEVSEDKLLISQQTKKQDKNFSLEQQARKGGLIESSACATTKLSTYERKHDVPTLCSHCGHN